MQYQYQVENIKCGGCTNTIITKLSEFDGVKDVLVDIENKQVTVEVESATDENIQQQLGKKLASLGYPLTGTAEANRLTTKATSYVSCALGKLGSKS